MTTMKMEFWILYMDHVYDKPVTIASELRTKATTMQQGKIDARVRQITELIF